MLRIQRHGDVTELRFSSWKSRASGYAVSAFVTRGVLIDAGFPDVVGELASWLDEARVDGAILTHAHEDHSAGVTALAARGIGVQRSALTDDWLRRDERVGLYRRFCWGPRRRLRTALADYSHPALRLHPTPGHSADHHVVWDAERGTVFGGDLFVGVKLRLAHHDEDVRAQVASLRSVAAWQPERFFDAHRSLVRDPSAQLRAKADWIEETIAAVEALVRQGWDDRRIRDRVLGPEDATGRWSFGQYSRLQWVRSVRETMADATPATSDPSAA